MEPEWLRDPAIVGNIAAIAKNREVKWTWNLPDGKQIGIRQTRIAWSRDFERWITMLGVDQRHLDIFISTNQLNWICLWAFNMYSFMIKLSLTRMEQMD